MVFTTNNEVFLKNIPNSKSIVCIQSSGEKKIATKKQIHNMNKKGFQNEIGGITNEGAKMFDLMANFEIGTKERSALEQRIRFIQLYQQMAIDELKGIVAKPMPKSWSTYQEGEDFLNSISVKKKPYFLRYRYKNLNGTLKNFIRQSELYSELTNESIVDNSGVDVSVKNFPVMECGGTMNKICKRIESEFDHIKFNKTNRHFNENLLKSGTDYDQKTYSAIKKLYAEYKRELRAYAIDANRNTRDEQKEYNKQRESFKTEFAYKALKLCKDEIELCDIVVDLCYKTDNSKQFAWDICGEQLIENLLDKNNRTMKYLYKDENGEIEYGGFKFSVGEKVI